ncbi:hypothetical protein Tco_0688100 [Tanacetum coccineum]
MNPVAAQQVTLDNALVAPDKRLKIEKCNMRIEFSKPRREPTFQVTLDVLKLSPCYLAFLITAEYFMRSSRSVPYSLTKILLNLPLNKKWCISVKSTCLDKLWPSRAKILWGMFYKKNVDFVALLDTPGVSVSKKKALATTDRSKGIDLLSEAALLEDAQLKKVRKRSKKETHSHQASGSGDGVGSQPKSWGESDDDSNDDVSDDDDNDDDSDNDGGDNDSDDESTESDDNQNDDDKEEEYDDEYVRTPSSYESTDDEYENVDEEEYDCIDKELYKDVNMELKDVEHEGKGDAEMGDAGHDNVTQEKTYDPGEDDAHVTLTAVYDTQKTEVPLQRSSVSFDFAT